MPLHKTYHQPAGTRDAITASDYASREYEGKDYVKARNKVVGLFLLSAAVSPIALVIVSIIVFRKQGFGVDYRRLPSALKAVLVCSLGVSLLMITILALLLAFDS